MAFKPSLMHDHYQRVDICILKYSSQYLLTKERATFQPEQGPDQANDLHD